MIKSNKLLMQISNRDLKTLFFNLKSFKLFGFFPIKSHMFYLGKRWTFSAQRNYLFDFFFLAAKNRFDSSIFRITHPTGQTVSLCVISDKVAETYPLHHS